MNYPLPDFDIGGKTAKRFEKLHMAAVSRELCIVCGRGPVEVHHCCSDRQEMFNGRRAPHLWTLPVCDFHHTAKFCKGGFPIHGMKSQWEAEFGKDWKLVPKVRLIIYGDEFITDREIEKYWKEHGHYHS